MMVKKKFETTPALILILISIILSGCSKAPEPNVAQTGNMNQAPTASNNIVASNNVPTNAPNVLPMGVNNAVTPNVDKDKKSLPPVKEPTPLIGNGGGDMFLFTQVRSALSSDQELLNSVIIEIKDGNAILTGKVSSEAQKVKAGQLVQKVQGIKGVKNNLRVSS